MKRPDHDDFWLLSKLVIDQDNVNESGVAMEDQVGRIVDPKSLAYMAQQRAIRAKSALGLPTVGTVVLASVWLDAFMLGAAYQAAKQSESTSEGES